MATAADYAHALYEGTTTYKAKTLDEFLAAFVQELLRDNALHTFRTILQFYMELLIRHEDAVFVTVSSPQELRSKDKDSFKKQFSSATSLEFITNPSLSPGVIVEVNTTRFDFTVDGRLQALSRSLQR